jgi:hypothetical protein
MMKKILLSSLFFLGVLALNSQIYASDAAYANFYSTAPQNLAGSAVPIASTSVVFEGQNASKKIFLVLPDSNSIRFLQHGVYSIIFTATGGVGSLNPPVIPPVLSAGSWSLGLFLNGVLIPGSIASSFSALDDLAVVNPNVIVGQAIVEVHKNSILTLSNTSTLSVQLVNDNSSGFDPSTSASIQIFKLHD